MTRTIMQAKEWYAAAGLFLGVLTLFAVSGIMSGDPSDKIVSAILLRCIQASWHRQCDKYERAKQADESPSVPVKIR